MALVKTTYLHHITDLANSRTQISDTAVDTQVLHSLMPASPPEGEFSAMLHSLPKELKQLLTALVNDAKSVPYLQQGRDRETNNEFLCRLIGADPSKINLEAMFRAHFAPV